MQNNSFISQELKAWVFLSDGSGRLSLQGHFFFRRHQWRQLLFPSLPPALSRCGPSRDQGKVPYCSGITEGAEGRMEEVRQAGGTTWTDAAWEKSSGRLGSFIHLSSSRVKEDSEAFLLSFSGSAQSACSAEASETGKRLSLCHWTPAWLSGCHFSKDLSISLQLFIGVLYCLSVGGEVSPYRVLFKNPIQTLVV